MGEHPSTAAAPAPRPGVNAIRGPSIQWSDVFYQTGLRVAEFPPGAGVALPPIEAALRTEGIDVAFILNPLDVDLAVLTADEGWFFGPSEVEWKQPTLPQAGVDTGPLRPGNYRRSLRSFTRPFPDGSVLELVCGPLTEVRYAEWRDIYLRNVVARPNGVDLAWASGPPPGGADRLLACTIHHSVGGRMVGGVILEHEHETGTLRIVFGAFERDREHRRRKLSYSCLEMARRIAEDRGARWLSYGSDPNMFVGDDHCLGLHRFKRSMGFAPERPRRRGQRSELRVLKVLNPAACGDFLLTYVLDPRLASDHAAVDRMIVVTCGVPPVPCPLPSTARFVHTPLPTFPCLHQESSFGRRPLGASPGDAAPPSSSERFVDHPDTHPAGSPQPEHDDHPSRPRLGLVYGLEQEFSDVPDLHCEWDTEAGIERMVSALADTHDVQRIPYDRAFQWIDALRRCDIVLSLAEGVRGPLREALVAGVLDQLAVPYIGSSSGTLAVCMDKRLAKLMVRDAGIDVPREVTCGPAVLKPRYEGSSQWVVFHRPADGSVAARLAELERSTGRPFIAEEWLRGREFTIGALQDERAPGGWWLDAAEVDYAAMDHPPIYDHHLKHDAEGSGRPHFYLERVTDAGLLETLSTMGRALVRALEIRDFCRFDVRMRGDTMEEGLCFLEANPLPGLVDLPAYMSDFPYVFSRTMSYAEMLRRIVESGCRRAFQAR